MQLQDPAPLNWCQTLSKIEVELPDIEIHLPEELYVSLSAPITSQT